MPFTIVVALNASASFVAVLEERDADALTGSDSLACSGLNCSAEGSVAGSFLPRAKSDDSSSVSFSSSSSTLLSIYGDVSNGNE